MTSTTKEKDLAAAVPEPPPKGNGRPILPLVLQDIKDRADMGLEKYGTLLRTGNGRNALMDAYQEAIDLVMYLRQELEEQALENSSDDRLKAVREQVEAEIMKYSFNVTLSGIGRNGKTDFIENVITVKKVLAILDSARQGPSAKPSEEEKA